MARQSLVIVLVAAALARCQTIHKLGIYGFLTAESTMVVLPGSDRLVIVEGVVAGSETYHEPANLNCPSYLRVRDPLSDTVLAFIPESCNHSFASATVTPEGQLWVFATPWARWTEPGHPVQGPCKGPVTSNCTVHAFHSLDATLETWGAPSLSAAVPPAGIPIYNSDVAPVNRSANWGPLPSGIPAHKWIMILESVGKPAMLFVNNGTASGPTGSLGSGWIMLDAARFNLPTHPGSSGCPSIRWDDSTGYYYTFSGGHVVYFARSKDLTTWQLSNQSTILNPSVNDTIIAPQWFGDYTPSNISDAAARIAKYANSSNGFGNDSDADLVEWTPPVGSGIPGEGTPQVLINYIAGNQVHTGTVALASFNGTQAEMFKQAFAPEQE